jgi:hypothetical protein
MVPMAISVLPLADTWQLAIGPQIGRQAACTPLIAPPVTAAMPSASQASQRSPVLGCGMARAWSMDRVGCGRGDNVRFLS